MEMEYFSLMFVEDEYPDVLLATMPGEYFCFMCMSIVLTY